MRLIIVYDNEVYTKGIGLQKDWRFACLIETKHDNIDGDKCYPNLKSLIDFLHEKPDFVITIVPSNVTEKVVEQCKIFGIDKIWMQPGSESEKAIKFCKENGIIVVHGVCIVVDALKNYKEFPDKCKFNN